MPIARSTVVGATAGVLLLAGAVGFGVGLPKVIDSDTAAGEPQVSAADLPQLPDRLDDRMIALSAMTAEDIANPQVTQDNIKSFNDGSAKVESSSAATLSSMYGGAQVRSYMDAKVFGAGQEAPAQLAVTVVPGASGIVIPSGPLSITPKTDPTASSFYEPQKVGGHDCAVAWQANLDQVTGQPIPGEVPAANYQAECRAERDGITYDVYATGLEPKEVAGYLDRVLEITEKG